MKWTIYDKTGSKVRCHVNKLEYNGEFMGASTVTCTVKSDHPIPFEIGDYLDYRGERYTINYDPSVIKRARANTAGDAFTYDGIVLNSYTDELVRCSFLDYVLNDNQIHFTSLPTFSFYAATVKDLADRIQANLNRIYKGDGQWTVNVHKNFEGEVNQNVSVNNLNVWDALALANTLFKANFIIRGRTITIGTVGVPASKLFQYGKGNGLKQIERTVESDQSVITRLRVYGSSKNMPARYYNKIGRNYFVSEVKDKHTSEERLVIGLDVNIGTEFKTGLFNNLVHHETGDTEFYDYKVEVKIGELLIDAHLECFTDGKTLSYLFSNTSICADTEKLKEAIRYLLANNPDKLYITKGVNLDVAPEGNMDKPKYMSDNMAVNFLMLPGFPETTLDPCIESKNIDALGVREGTVIFDGSEEGKEEIYPSIEGMTAEELKKAGIQVDMDEGDNGMLDEVYDAEQTTENGLMSDISDGKEVPNFTVTLKDIGFDINDHLSSDTATLSMKDGMCGGREFEIEKCERKGNKWILTCKRVEDSSLGLYFPYKDYNIKKGDKYVLLGIEMPEAYVKAASQRLLEAGKKYLSENDYVRYSYTPKIDDLAMARQHDNHKQNQEISIHDSLKEGDLILFEDSDLGISGNVILDSLTIVEGDSLIPHYEVSLRNEKTVGTLDKIQNQIDSILSGNGKGAGLNTEQVTNIVKALGAKNYLSKIKPDSTAYLLKLLGGAEVGEAIDSFISGKGTILDKNGRIQTDRLEVRNSLKVLELIINRIQGMENDFVFAPTRKVVKVEKVDDTTYKLTLDPLREGDLIPFREGNIIYSIVNDLLTGGSSYYTSYMRVLTTNQNEYSITVSLYPDAEVPGGKNYLPAEGYNVSRRGDVHLPEEGQSNPDAQSWYISSSEGRLLFLQNVVKPILEDYNYALSIGKFPRVQAVEDIGLPEDAVGVMAETIVAQHIYQYDYNGDVVANKVNRGAWAREVAESDKPYRRVTMESIRPTGTKYTLLEQHTVYHLGCLWGCLADKTTEEPKWNAQGWQLLEGNGELTLNLQLDGTEAFHIGEVDVDILAQVLFGHNDITEDVRAQKGFVAEWFRDTENAPADNLWKPAYVGDDKLRIHIDNGNEHGVGSDFGFGCKKVVFTCRVYVPVDGGMRQLEQSLGFNLV